MTITRKRFTIALILLAIIASAALLTGRREDQPQWRTVKVTRGNITDVVTASGTLNPVQLVTVGTQISGQVSHVYAQANDEVKKGQLLAEIDPSLLMAQYKQDQSSMETARVNFEQAGRDLERTKMLLAKDYVARVDLEHAQQSYLSAKNGYESVKAQMERDQVNLGYAKIVSPIDGIVISQDVSLGQTMAASFQSPSLFKIAGDLTQMKIDVNLSEADISKVKANMPVTFTVDAFPGREFTGKVQTVNVNPNNQQGVVTYTAVVSVNNKDKVLLPGMTAYVTITLSEVKDVLRVPAAALRFTPPETINSGGGLLSVLRGGGMRTRMWRGHRPDSGPNNEQTIYLLRDGELIPAQVTTGRTDGSNIAISGADVKEGDTVVTGILPSVRS